MVTRLAFKIPEYSPRTIWTSPAAREAWQPRIQQISQAWEQVERLLVVQGLRPSALQNISPEQLPLLLKDMAQHGLVALPLVQVPRVDGYAAQGGQAPLGATWDYRVAITRAEHTVAWTEAWAKSENDAIGKLLGYPECCRKFFDRVWSTERWFDTTWPMAEGTEGAERLNAPGMAGASVAPGINILWRWHGVRSVSHLPCSFACQASIELGETALRVMQSVAPEEAAWLAEILSWPVEWSALHGIAEIRTPISRTSVATDATAGKLVVRYKGLGYPAEGAQGIGFPHQASVPKLAKLIPMSNPADNGFSNAAAMREAHSKLLAPLAGKVFKTVLDLGCGDGLLLSKIPATRRVGVEISHAIAAKAAGRLDRVIVGDVTNSDFIAKLLAEEKPDLVIAQNVRNPPESLRDYTILSYSYDSGAPPQLLET